MPGNQGKPTRGQEEEERLSVIFRQRIAGRPDIGVELLDMLCHLCKACPFESCSHYTDTTQHMKSHLDRIHKDMEVPQVVSDLDNIVAKAELLARNANHPRTTAPVHDASAGQLLGTCLPAPDHAGMADGLISDCVTTEPAHRPTAPNRGIPPLVLAPTNRAGPWSYQPSDTFSQQNDPARIQFDSPPLEDENNETFDAQAGSIAFDNSNPWTYQEDMVNPYSYNPAGTTTVAPQGNNDDPFGMFQSVILPFNQPWNLDQATDPLPSDRVPDSDPLLLTFDNSDTDLSFFLGPFPNPPSEGRD